MNIIPFIIPVYTLILILIGLGYSISFNTKYTENESSDKVLGVLINISTISSLIIWCYFYLPMLFFRKTTNYSQQVNNLGIQNTR